MVLLSRFAIPAYRFHFVLAHASARVVAAAQIVLSLVKIVFGRFAKPFHRFRVICRYAKPGLVKYQTEFKLGFGISLFRLDAKGCELRGDSIAWLGVSAWQKQTGGAEQRRAAKPQSNDQAQEGR